MPDDAALLRRYAQDRAEDAFAELVRRHVDGVYSTALRRVGGDTHLAEDVTQQVFVALAQKATSLSHHPVLTGWLYLTTRHESANVVRTEQRRKVREQEAHSMNETVSDSGLPADWTRVAPVLDDAIDQLGETDRTAVLLRFIGRRSFAEIGNLLRITEDAARMRHERALEKLRVALGRRGITSTSAALGLALANHAVSAAPALLSAAIGSSVAAATGAAVSAPAITLINFMSTAKLTLTLAGLVLLSGAAALVYRTTVIAPQAGKESAAPQLASGFARPASDAPPHLARLRPIATEQLASEAAGITDSAAKIAELKELLARLPAQSIPELQLATEGDWYGAVDGELKTPEDYRRALTKLRNSAINRFAKIAQPALQAFLKASGGQFPNDATQLQPFLEGNSDPALLRRYRIAPASEITNVKMGGDWVITQTTLIDADLDSTFVIGPYGFGSTSVSPAAAKDQTVLQQVMKNYKEVTGGAFQDPLEIEKLIPYASGPEQRAAIQRAAQRAKAKQ